MISRDGLITVKSSQINSNDSDVITATQNLAEKN